MFYSPTKRPSSADDDDAEEQGDEEINNVRRWPRWRRQREERMLLHGKLNSFQEFQNYIVSFGKLLNMRSNSFCFPVLKLYCGKLKALPTKQRATNHCWLAGECLCKKEIPSFWAAMELLFWEKLIRKFPCKYEIKIIKCEWRAF